MAASRSVPLYVGRILSPSGVPQGTCFQLAPGYLVTAWHVVQATLALGDDEALRVDRLSDPGAGRITARVAADDRRADLALLKADASFPESARLLRGARTVKQSEPVTVVGHALIQEAGDRPPVVWVEALGEWQGEASRADGVVLGRFYSRDILSGMSGAPVRQRNDDSVVGVVSARYNTSDGWLVHSVWASRVDELRSLCEGHVDLGGSHWVGFTAAGAATAVAESLLRKPGTDPGSEIRVETARASDQDRTEALPPQASSGGAVDTTPTGTGGAVSDAITEEVTQSVLERAARWFLDSL
ncbi:serine protease [Streptomyces sp. IB2014 016-6]|uniref:trypsin-like serine peptidase n=1 Tax=Streptomyces sp. IB2014 016-6 TaxID=2517818 RepID=UPI0011C71B47|nr:serine protease [Streptomyces sp. IB2014 016-6]TXL88071.1 serine protease [Streptomyces sp. IB2014 016-6]